MNDSKQKQLSIGIITQARMTSSRLPGKILKEVKQQPLLHYHLERLQKTGFPVFIATTVNETDDCICQFALERAIRIYRGSEDDVLSRYYEAAKEFGLDVIVRVTSDCPLIDPHLIRNAIEKYLQLNNLNLYMSNVIERTFARGFDFEIFSFASLEEAFRNATSASDREHVTPYIWNNRSGSTEFYHITQLVNHQDLRITVDTTSDFELIKILMEKYHADQLNYSEIETILVNHPILVNINKDIVQKKI